MKRILFAIVFSALLSACASTPPRAQKASYIAACPQGSSIIKVRSHNPFFTDEASIAIAPSEAHITGASVRFCMPAETAISSACRPIPIHGSTGTYCMPSGTNTILVSVDWRPPPTVADLAIAYWVPGGVYIPRFASEWVIVPLLASRLYEARAHYNRSSSVFQISFVDVDVDSEKVVYEFSLHNRTVANPDKPRDLTVPAQQ